MFEFRLSRMALAFGAAMLGGVMLSGAQVAVAEDLGIISVDSSTIDLQHDDETQVSNVQIIDQHTIETIDPKNIIDVLKTVPGVTAVARAGEVIQFRFRGVGQQQFMGEQPGVAVIVDGVPVKAIAGGIRLNLGDIKSIKVIKGSASYLYGDAALSGAIVITTKPQVIKNESSVSTQFGSYGYREYEASTTQGTENFSLNLNGSYRSTDGYWEDAELWTKSLNGKLSYYVDDTSDLTLGVDVTDKYDQAGTRATVDGETAAIENPRGEADDGYTKDSGIDLEKYFLSYNKDFRSSNLKVTTYQYNDLYDQLTNPQDIDADPSTPNVYVFEGHQDLRQEGVKSEFSTEGQNIASLIGLELGRVEDLDRREILADFSDYDRRLRRDVDYYEGEISETKSEETVQAVYGELRYDLTPRVTGTINSRYDVKEKRYTSLERDFDGAVWSNAKETESETFRNTAYRVGGTYKLSDATTLFSSVSTGFQTPDVTDLTYFDQDTGTIQKTGVKDQTSINYEIGVRGAVNSDLRYEASVFQLDNMDIIGPEGGTYAFGDPSDNIGDSRSKGLELSLESDRSKTWSFAAAYTYLDAKYTTHKPHDVVLQDRTVVTHDIVGNELPRVSDHTVDLLVNYRATDNLIFTAETYAKSDYWADETNIIRMDGYEVVNAQARYKMSLGGNRLELFAKVDNLLDEQYYRSVFVHRDRRGDIGLDREDLSIVVDPGRVYYAGLKYFF